MPTRPTEARKAPPQSPDAATLAGELYEEQQSYLRRFAWTQLGRAPEDAVEDVVQSALLAFIQSYPGDATDREGALRYLLVAVRTAAWRFHRSTARKSAPLLPIDELAGSLSILATGTDPEEVALEREHYEARRELLAKLSAAQRACLALSALGFTTAESAAALGLTTRQVRRHITKGNRPLRDLEGGTR